MKIHIIQHESFEGLGAIATWIDCKQYIVTITRCYAGDPFPTSVAEFDFLIIMGGPQSPDTTPAEYPHFDGKKEIAFIQKAIVANKLVLGVCLGAQLIGNAYGAHFEHSPQREIGVFPLTLTPAAQQDPFFATQPSQLNVAHWHGDMPGLTKEAVVLATSQGCPRQVIRYSNRVYGFQCHFEFDRPTVIENIEHSAHELKDAEHLPYIQDPKIFSAQDFTAMNQLMHQFLDFMVSK